MRSSAVTPGKSANRICRPYSHDSAAYAQAFELFLERTDQKKKARDEISKIFHARKVRSLVDAGAGDGMLTSWVCSDCTSLTLIEPNQYLAEKAAQRLPSAKIIHANILDVHEQMDADAVLLAHVFFHIPPEGWMATLAACGKLLKSGGIIILLLQNRHTDYMKIFDLLGVPHTNLDFIVEQKIPAKIGMDVLEFYQIPSYVECRNENDLIEIGNFQLNCLPGWSEMSAEKLIDLTSEATSQICAYPKRVSCSQDMLVLRKTD